jgi:hypothetical protein
MTDKFKQKGSDAYMSTIKTIEVKSPPKLLHKEGKERRSVAKMVLL